MRDMKQDVDFGMFFSNMVMWFIILATGTVLFNGGIHQIDTVEQAAQALKPLAGESAYLLFCIGRYRYRLAGHTCFKRRSLLHVL